METWKKVSGTEYEVSDYGNVRNKRGRHMSGSIQTTGYRQVKIGSKFRLVHRLVLEAFNPCPDPSMIVDHKDGDKLNNRLSNLRWATYQQNSRNRQSKGYSCVGDKFVACISFNGKSRYLGCFKTAEEARNAYKTMALSIDSVFYSRV